MLFASLQSKRHSNHEILRAKRNMPIFFTYLLSLYDMFALDITKSIILCQIKGNVFHIYHLSRLTIQIQRSYNDIRHIDTLNLRLPRWTSLYIYHSIIIMSSEFQFIRTCKYCALIPEHRFFRLVCFLFYILLWRTEFCISIEYSFVCGHSKMIKVLRSELKKTHCHFIEVRPVPSSQSDLTSVTQGAVEQHLIGYFWFIYDNHWINCWV